MKLSKYLSFVAKYPWFPSAVSCMVEWQGFNPRSRNKDEALKRFFAARVAHLGVTKDDIFDLDQEGTVVEKHAIASMILPPKSEVYVIRTHRVVYHKPGQPRFSKNHAMFNGSIRDAMNEYGHGVEIPDAVIQQTLTRCGNLVSHRFDVAIYP